MSRLKGHVDRADQLLIEGWALDLDAPDDSVNVCIVQDGQILLSLRPIRRSQDVVRALGLEVSEAPTHRWRWVFPLANGLRPDLPFSVCFAGTDTPLARGRDLSIPLAPGMDAEVEADLARITFMTPSYRLEGSALRIGVMTQHPAGGPMPELDVDGVRCPSAPIQTPVFRGKQGAFASVALDPSTKPALRERVSTVALTAPTARTQREVLHASLCAIAVPPGVFDPGLRIGPLPGESNLRRISGPNASDLTYQIGGATTFMQMDRLAKHYFGRHLTQFETVLDWGSGCARVLRQFRETAPYAGLPTATRQSLVGLDIDEVNIAWCQHNVPQLGRFGVLGLDGFEEPDASVDLLYGISVMTHLTELNQSLWLEEIARILKPGGCALLTTHGEYATYRINDNIALPFVDRFGFFDALPDAAIGADRDTYYRATYQSRAHVRQLWGRRFEILDVVAAANSFIQDFVVLRRR